MQEYRTLNPISMKSMRIKYLIETVICAVLAAAFYFADGYEPGMIYGTAFFGALTVIAVIITAVFPKIYYNHYRYFISDDRVDVRCGILFLKHNLVPIERIHQVEVVSGPINRMFGLAKVEVTTAGGTSDISYLEKDEADRIADELNKTVSRIVRSQNE